MEEEKRVELLMRRNILRHQQSAHQRKYQEALQQELQRRKREALKDYGRVVQLGNLKARQESQLKQRRKRRRPKTAQPTHAVAQEVTDENAEGVNKEVATHKKMSESERIAVEKAISTRAAQHLQEMQLEKLNKKLEEERKKTKLVELNQKCLRLLRVPVDKSPSTLDAVRLYEKRVMEEVAQIDALIMAKGRKEKNIQGSKQGNKQENRQENRQGKIENECDSELELGVLFCCTSQQLLNMPYIPL